MVETPRWGAGLLSSEHVWSAQALLRGQSRALALRIAENLTALGGQGGGKNAAYFLIASRSCTSTPKIWRTNQFDNSRYTPETNLKSAPHF